MRPRCGRMTTPSAPIAAMGIRWRAAHPWPPPWPIRSVTAVEHPAADRAAAYGLASILIDGNDADVVYEMARQTIGKARAGDGPSLVEALTYRHGGHSRGDPAKYRPEAEVREWLERDPVKRYRERLLG